MMKAYQWPAIKREVRCKTVPEQLDYIQGELEEARAEVLLPKTSWGTFLAMVELNDVIIAAETAKRMLQEEWSYSDRHMADINEDTFKKNDERGYWEKAWK